MRTCVYVDIYEYVCVYVYICVFDSKSKVGDPSRGWPEGSFFNSYYTKV